MIKVTIDPACNFFYSSFYIKGLYDLFRENVSFSSGPFTSLRYTGETHCLSFVVSADGIILKVVIDFADAPDINEDFLEWSDIFGKVNYRSDPHSADSRIVTVAPNYALKIWSKPAAGIIGVLNYLKSSSRTIDFHTYISKYLMSARKLKDLAEINGETEPDYVYFASTLWSSQDETNMYRANFIRACKAIPGIRFEGGMIPEKPGDGISGYEDIIIKSPVDYVEYINNVKRSSVVFNTPAYHFCHGWKLPEYLALGKAIISTPFYNELPEKLTHMENIYFVSGSIEEIIVAVNKIINDNDLRKKLEHGAGNYFREHVSPDRALRRLIWMK